MCVDDRVQGAAYSPHELTLLLPSGGACGRDEQDVTETEGHRVRGVTRWCADAPAGSRPPVSRERMTLFEVPNVSGGRAGGGRHRR
ncbi:hypothetical protein GCM10010503_38510 [Streptomyces lucensis JCM 4490]|uniref:Uncharacterized protein n=1 Tax=Streptomyces lucensis JCM 4490 TaxID=1306176 RepID=A0A918JBF7_9ACTN|nr:hypothetical protein GCM10010503_38510 [Streptomyces lucensis JCM 4490]